MQRLLELSHDTAPGAGRGAAALVMPGPPLRLYCRVPPLRLRLPGAATPPLTRFLQAAAALAPAEAGPCEPECPQPPPPSPMPSFSTRKPQPGAGLAAAAAPEGLAQLDLGDADEWGHAEEVGEEAAEEEAAAAELTLAAEFRTPPRPLPPAEAAAEAAAAARGGSMTAWLHLEPSGLHVRSDAAAELCSPLELRVGALRMELCKRAGDGWSELASDVGVRTSELARLVDAALVADDIDGEAWPFAPATPDADAAARLARCVGATRREPPSRAPERAAAHASLERGFSHAAVAGEAALLWLPELGVELRASHELVAYRVACDDASEAVRLQLHPAWLRALHAASGEVHALLQTHAHATRGDRTRTQLRLALPAIDAALYEEADLTGLGIGGGGSGGGGGGGGGAGLGGGASARACVRLHLTGLAVRADLQPAASHLRFELHALALTAREAGRGAGGAATPPPLLELVPPRPKPPSAAEVAEHRRNQLRRVAASPLAAADAADAARYAGFFQHLDEQAAGKLSRVQAEPLLARSQLSDAALAQVWALADADGDDLLDFAEFKVATHVHCMCTACALHVHCMCTACT